MVYICIGLVFSAHQTAYLKWNTWTFLYCSMEIHCNWFWLTKISECSNYSPVVCLKWVQLHTSFWQPRKSLLVRLVIFVERYSREKVTNSNVTEPFGIFIIWANRVSAPKSDALCYWPNISDYIKGHFHPSKWFSTLKFLQIKFKREKVISRQIKTPRKKKKTSWVRNFQDFEDFRWI